MSLIIVGILFVLFVFVFVVGVGFIMYFKGHLGGFPALYKKYMDTDYTCDEFNQYIMNKRNRVPKDPELRDPVLAKLKTKYPRYVKDRTLIYKLTVFFQKNDIHKRMSDPKTSACKMLKKRTQGLTKCDSDKYQPEIKEISKVLKDC